MAFYPEIPSNAALATICITDGIPCNTPMLNLKVCLNVVVS